MTDPGADLVVNAAAEAEQGLTRALRLAPLTLDAAHARQDGSLRGQPVTIQTRAYRGPQVVYARFVLMRGPGLAIANLLTIPRAEVCAPLFGADLVALPGKDLLVVADLSPLSPDAGCEAAVLQTLAARRRAAPPLPSAGSLPPWCARWFSPWALFARVPTPQQGDARRAFEDVWQTLATTSPVPSADAPQRQAAAGRYCAEHRQEDPGLRLLATVFDPAWAASYIDQVLFPVLLPP